ncbi:NAD-dependent epimerase/dehydratase family protein [Thermotalea metallivorans]|uniref:NAD-dependent epimerase/dehydratase domain-containing protein n=1 Tax=Thermotalea metallivorans TaxID=520762 RepID=A0A140KZA4_9FIRM|nr:NAD-dependent epimerase/dehydratase family protein [Thermotalea metallivorans]KXG73629.1 hypothetical protein AN619_30360 [Thermotalea metallivorans]
MKLLVLGGTHHVGRAVVEEALARGDEVTTLNRGLSRSPAEGVEAIVADRYDQLAMSKALGNRIWDAVIDTWAWAPRVVRDTVELLSGRVSHYGYVSSRAVYQWPWPSGADETAPLVKGDPNSEDSTDYPAAKRGGELAVINAFKERALLARPGMILGPYEDLGRIPWWIRRIEKGGRILAPGPAETPLQYIDARDMALWMLSAAERGLGGAYNVGTLPGFVTIGELLYTIKEIVGSNAEFIWVEPDILEKEGFMLGMELGLRYPDNPKPSGIHDANVVAAHKAGLICRPLRETIADTWRWMQEEKNPKPHPVTPPPDVWFDSAKEQEVLQKFYS